MSYSPPYTARELKWDFELRDLMILDHARAARIQAAEEDF